MAMSALLATGAAKADDCDSWGHKSYPVTMQACSYTSGGSGYTVITNDGTKRARICWRVVTNSGRELDGCHTLDSGESSRASCASCGSKNGGARHILLRSYEFR